MAQVAPDKQLIQPALMTAEQLDVQSTRYENAGMLVQALRLRLVAAELADSPEWEHWHSAEADRLADRINHETPGIAHWIR